MRLQPCSDRSRKAARPSRIALVLALALTASAPAFAQGTMNAERPPAEPAPASSSTTAEPAATVATPAPADSSAAAQPAASATTTAPAQSAAPPVVAAAPAVPAVPAQGQWVYSDTYGWIWVPQGASTVVVQEQPYVYLYTPVYGWTWYASPWGPGVYYYGPWVHHGYGPARVWHRGGWYAPHVVVRRPGPAPGHVYRGGGGGGHRGGHR